MTRRQEHERIEKMERELAQLRADHQRRVHDDCCCHDHPHYWPIITQPYWPYRPNWPQPYWIANGTGNATGDNTSIMSGGQYYNSSSALSVSSEAGLSAPITVYSGGSH